MALSEQELIQRYFRPLAGIAGLGLVDDVALIRPEPGHDIIATTDLITEGVHFLAQDPAGAIAAKALRVNLSDLYAKGAEPIGYLLNLGLGDDCGEAWVSDFADGLARDQERYGVRLVGGDTSRVDGGSVIAITAFGQLPQGEMVARGGARPDDVIVVSGTIGDAALGLEIRNGKRLGSAEIEQHLMQRLLYPEPRAEAAPLIRRFATAAMDVSDGLVGDLAKLCSASGASAIVEADLVPLSEPALFAIAAESRLFEIALTGGEDFEILATIPPALLDEFISAAGSVNVAFVPIGRISADGGPPVFIDGEGQPMEFQQLAYDHFAGSRRP